MFFLNFGLTSTAEAWCEDIALVAADDLTPIDADADNVIVTLQLRAHIPRGFTDQAAWHGYDQLNTGISGWPAPVINMSTDDGSGQLGLADGVLSINVPAATMRVMPPGFYNIGIIMTSVDSTVQLAAGLLPIYDGGVFVQ